MSFILDALKKSELERQRQTIPGLMDAHPLKRRTRFPVWAVALVVLLGVNLAVLLLVLLRGSPRVTDAAPTPVPALPVASATAPPAARGAPLPAASAPQEPAAAATRAAAIAPQEAPVAATLAASAAPHQPAVAAMRRPAGAAPGAAPERAAEHFSPMAAPAHTRDPVLNSAPEKPDDEVLPTISEIDLSSQPPLPDLHLDVHVFAARPADRFVYIDMRKYREGAALADGLTLERIRRDGVVLNYRGLRFVLPRQQ
jgi:general secretion pathway protein B